ncbi:hypothetical protein B0T26DRAFT_738802 [Lasiosphaeria miniovina]|uniref:Protein SSH4 n=1 Tax=Lasiosphaeria miniovina TaxID=1954250 RepID=A0AA40B6H8_9PEZI|nr:uncharacterized protein B0T26DRAFT_738802 [Lasiosphaeria miniovina]KAK0728469.1 hypothetical protein B0T26DRAFT_738802 [Lasiosphaeria miniovina]
MTNPFQHFAGDSSTGGTPTPLVPTLLGQRRTSYASVVSGTPGLARPTRAGAFSHLLNPAADSDSHSNLYATARNYNLDAGMAQGRNGVPGSGSGSGRGGGSGAGGGDPGDSGDDGPIASLGPQWQPRPGNGLPWFSRAFDHLITPDELLASAGITDFSFGGALASAGGSGFLSPSYLRGSVYLQELEEAHRAKLIAEREGNAAKTQAAAGLASNGSTQLQGASKLPSGTHRGVAFELVEKQPVIEDDDDLNPLPSRWNKDDKDTSLDVLGDGLEVKFTGRTTSEHEACSIRADYPMPALCGVYYFELTVLNKKRDETTIGIGFSSRSVSLQRPPGWEPESWGYHGDDGRCFAAQNVGKSYGPKFGSGDTAGCLVNFRLGHALFTKNGVDLGIAFRDVNFKDVKGKLYPTIGLKKPGDHVLVNFGQRPFQFDIDGYMKKQQKMISDSIKNADPSSLAPPLAESELIQQLVLQFLQHDGYVESARAFAEEILGEKKALCLGPNEHVEGINIKDDEDANNRQRIRRAILDGDIDRALKYVDMFYPSVLKDNEQVYFSLRCRKFIEMIRKEAELNLLLEKKLAKFTKRRFSQGVDAAAAGAQISHGEEDDEEMLEVDEVGNGHGNGHWTGGHHEEAEDDDGMDVEDGASANGNGFGGVSKLSQDALAYGMELRAEFHADPRREISHRLEEIFALIAYPNPLKVKEVAHLLDGSGRVTVAEELNSAILMSLGKSSRAALENVFAQTVVLLEDLRKDGGDGAFVTVQSVFDEVPMSSPF